MVVRPVGDDDDDDDAGDDEGQKTEDRKKPLVALYDMPACMATEDLFYARAHTGVLVCLIH